MELKDIKIPGIPEEILALNPFNGIESLAPGADIDVEPSVVPESIQWN